MTPAQRLKALYNHLLAMFLRGVIVGSDFTIEDIARSEGVTHPYVGRMLKLAYLAPPVLEKLLTARVLPVVSVKELAEAAELPGQSRLEQFLAWNEALAKPQAYRLTLFHR